VLFVGNLIVSKGAGDLVRACALLRDRGISFECRLVGQGSDATMIRRLIGVRGLDDRVTLVGVRPHAELVDWYRASDVVALPSHSEGIPNVLREAMACGRPFVATPVGGIPEIADPSFSRLAPAGDVVELANALATMLASPPRVDMDIVRRINISWEESARQVALELERAVASRNPRAIPS
jgi:glycosyltransferase involved in cell wall biosynthesis